MYKNPKICRACGVEFPGIHPEQSDEKCIGCTMKASKEKQPKMSPAEYRRYQEIESFHYMDC